MLAVVNFSRQLIAVPVRLLVWICGFVPIFDRLRLVKILWFLGREVEDGSAVIGLAAAQEGMDSARHEAERIFAQCNEAHITATIAWLEVQHDNDYSAAHDWVQKAKQADCANEQMLLMMELVLSTRLAEYNQAQIVERILSRNDLPMQFTREALLCKGGLLVNQHRWNQARRIAERILSIEDNEHARKLAAFVDQNTHAGIGPEDE